MLTLSIFVLIATSGIVLHAHAKNPPEASQQELAANTPLQLKEGSHSIVCVSPGDTLWSIAKTYGPEGVNVKSYVQIIIEANALETAALQVGQVLILP